MTRAASAKALAALFVVHAGASAGNGQRFRGVDLKPHSGRQLAP
jgi:hypothetical protein